MHAFEFTLVVMDHVGILVLLDAEHCVGVGVFGLFIPNQAFSFDTNDCRARVFDHILLREWLVYVRCRHR